VPTSSSPPLTLRDGLLHATLSWQTLVVLTVALASAAMVASATPLVLGACLATALAGLELLRPRFWQRLAAERERALRTLPSAAEVLDPSLRTQVAALRQCRYDARNAIGQASPSLQRHLCPSLSAQLESLEGDAALLVREGERIATLLRAGPSPRSLEHELQELTARIDTTGDEGLRLEWERTAEVRRRELETLRRLESERELVAATLARVTATLRWLPLQLAELDLLEGRGGKSPRHRLQEALSSLHTDLAATSDSLRALLDEHTEVALLES
jgi:hypothetical protein